MRFNDGYFRSQVNGQTAEYDTEKEVKGYCLEKVIFREEKYTCLIRKNIADVSHKQTDRNTHTHTQFNAICTTSDTWAATLVNTSHKNDVIMSAVQTD